MAKIVSLRGAALPPETPPLETVADFLRRMAETPEAANADGAVLILDNATTAAVTFSDSVAEQSIAHMLGLLEFAKTLVMGDDDEG